MDLHAPRRPAPLEAQRDPAARVTEPAARKAALRRAVLARRDAIGADERRRLSEAIFARVAALEWFGAARTVLAYSAFGSEPVTEPFLRVVLARAKTLVLPKVNRATHALDVFCVVAPETELEPGVFGVREPVASRCAPASLDPIDFVLVPGVVFDARGGRIGHGAGYYDRLLARCGPGTHLVAAAFEVQIVDEVPMEPHDRRVDLVVTELRAYPAG